MKRLILILILLASFAGSSLPVHAQQWVPVLSDVFVKKFVISPAYGTDGIIYCIDEIHGLYQSVNQGLNWVKIYETADPNDPSEWITDVIISPDFSNDHTLLMVKGYGDILQSSNGGDDWILLTSPGNEYVKSIAFSADYLLNHTIFCWTFNGAARFWRTTNPGISWNFVSEFSIPFEFDILKSALTGTGSQTLFCGERIGANFLQSNDEGISWFNVSGWSGASELTDFSCSPGFINDSTIFTTVYYEGVAESNVMKNIHGGGQFSWQLCAPFNDYIVGVSLSPSFFSDGILIIGGDSTGVLKSSDGGNTWTTMNTGLTNHRLLAVAIADDDPFEAFASTYNVGALPDKIWKFTSTVSVEEKTPEVQFMISPNPACDRFEIEINKTEFEVNVMNIYGKVLLMQRNQKIISIPSLPSGTYIVEIKADDLSGNQRIIVY